jgi:hypothetical protein
MNSERGPGGNVPTGKSITVKPPISQKQRQLAEVVAKSKCYLLFKRTRTLD